MIMHMIDNNYKIMINQSHLLKRWEHVGPTLLTMMIVKLINESDDDNNEDDDGHDDGHDGYGKRCIECNEVEPNGSN